MAQVAIHDVPGIQRFFFHLPAVALGQDAELPVLIMPFKAVVVACGVVFETIVTGDNTDYFTLSLRERSGLATLASLAFTTGTNGTALAVTSLTVATAAATAILADVVLTLRKVEANSGLAQNELQGYIDLKGA